MEREAFSADGKVEGEGTCGDSSQTERVGSKSGVAKMAGAVRWCGMAGTAGTLLISSLLRCEPREEVNDLTRLRKGRSAFLATVGLEPPTAGDVEGVSVVRGEPSYGMVTGEEDCAGNSCDGVLGVPFGVIDPLTFVKKPPSLPREGCCCCCCCIDRADRAKVSNGESPS